MKDVDGNIADSCSPLADHHLEDQRRFRRKGYTREEVDHARSAVAQQLHGYRQLVKAGAASPDFETLFFNNMTIVLDRYFVHRLRIVTGKDGNALNEVQMLADSLMNNGTLRANNVIKFIPDQSVTKLHIGDPVRLTAEDFERLSAAFFAEIERKFL